MSKARIPNCGWTESATSGGQLPAFLTNGTYGILHKPIDLGVLEDVAAFRGVQQQKGPGIELKLAGYPVDTSNTVSGTEEFISRVVEYERENLGDLFGMYTMMLYTRRSTIKPGEVQHEDSASWHVDGPIKDISEADKIMATFGVLPMFHTFSVSNTVPTEFKTPDGVRSPEDYHIMGFGSTSEHKCAEATREVERIFSLVSVLPPARFIWVNKEPYIVTDNLEYFEYMKWEHKVDVNYIEGADFGCIRRSVEPGGNRQELAEKFINASSNRFTSLV